MALQNVSGLTIRQIESGQELPSTCPGNVRFHREAGLGTKSYEVDAGTATPCDAGDPFTSAPLTPTEAGPGTFVLTVVPATGNFLEDTFTDADNTNLVDHVPEIGGEWLIDEASSGGSEITEIAAGDAMHHSAAIGGTVFAFNLADPPSANYNVELQIDRLATGIDGQHTGCLARWDGNGSGYACYIILSALAPFFHLVLTRWNAGVPTDLIDVTGEDPPIGTSTLFLTCDGDDITIELTGNFPHTVADPAPIGGAGHVGIYSTQVDADNTGMHFLNQIAYPT